MLYVIRASTAMESELRLWSGDCDATGKKEHDLDANLLAVQLMQSHRSLDEANERFWDLLAQQIAAEERSAVHEQ